MPVQTNRLILRALSVFQQLLARYVFVKQEQTTRKSLVEHILRKVSFEVTMKVMVFFGVFGVIGAMVLPISLEQIELACDSSYMLYDEF